MEIQVITRPIALLEVADLVCAYVNGIPPKQLTEEGAGYIPAAEIAKMMEEVCGGLDRDSGKLKLYFRGYSMEDSGGTRQQLASVGCLLLSLFDHNGSNDPNQMRRELHDHYIGTGRPYRINTFGDCGFGWDPCDEYCSISDELDKLAMPEGLRLRLAEVLSGYHCHVDQLCDLLEPLAQRLEPLLQPWVEKLRPQMERWSLALHTDADRRDFTSRFTANLDECRKIVMMPRMLYPSVCRGTYSRAGVLCCRAGIGLRIGQAQKPALIPSELAALRQLSGADRIEMLRAMAGQAMGPREIARKLGVNPGTVFRDLNNMTQAHLLKIVISGSSHAYVTDMDFLKKTAQRLVEYIESGQ